MPSHFTDEPEHVGQLRDSIRRFVADETKPELAYGLSEGYDMERHVRDVLGMPIVGGSSNMQKNNIANRLGLATGPGS